jgi:D-alanyl-D-alanine carboxypeptidase
MDANAHRKLDALCDQWSKRPRVGSLALRVKTADGDEFVSAGSDNRLFLIASVTKTFFAALVMQLVRENRVDLREPVASYVPAGMMDNLCVVDGVDYSAEITVMDVVSHTSGIPDYYATKRLDPSSDIAAVTAADPGWSPEEALEIARKLPGSFRPHSGKSHYSFTNYQLVGHLITQVTGVSLSEALRKRISEPLGLRSTTLLTPDTLDLFDQSEPIYYNTQAYRGARRMASLGAEGAIVSTTADVMAFLDALVDNTLVTNDEWAMMGETRGQPFPRVDYGMGVMTLRLPSFLTGFRSVGPLIGHTGATGFFMFWNPDSGTRIVGSVNQLAKPLESVTFLGRVARRVAR